jgi:hypothetical protein
VIDIAVIVGEHGDGSIDTLMVLSYTRRFAGTAEWKHVQVVHYGVGSEMRLRRLRSLTKATGRARGLFVFTAFLGRPNLFFAQSTRTRSWNWTGRDRKTDRRLAGTGMTVRPRSGYFNAEQHASSVESAALAPHM